MLSFFLKVAGVQVFGRVGEPEEKADEAQGGANAQKQGVISNLSLGSGLELKSMGSLPTSTSSWGIKIKGIKGPRPVPTSGASPRIE